MTSSLTSFWDLIVTFLRKPSLITVEEGALLQSKNNEQEIAFQDTTGFSEFKCFALEMLNFLIVKNQCFKFQYLIFKGSDFV